MSAKKKHKERINNFTLKIHFVCPNTEEFAEIELSKYDFNSYSSDCDLCGSHGETYIDIIQCPSCNKYHKVHLQEW